MAPLVRALRDEHLTARVVARTALLYAEGPDPSLDRPAHVRAGSGLARVGAFLYAVQDDANFIARIDPATGSVRAITLPAGHEGLRQFDDVRGNKKWKLDLEACAVLDAPDGPVLFALGSGSSPRRERVLVARALDADAPDVRLVDASRLYAAWRADREFAGSELNLEGVAVVGPVVRFFQRGNGAPGDGVAAVNATCDVALDAWRAFLEDAERAPVPAFERVVQYDLGAVGGAPLTFTDACAGADGEVLYLAAAEDCPDAVRDGPVTGAALGVIDARGARWTPLVNIDGRPLVDKPEGLTLDRARPESAWVILDRDDPACPSELCELRVKRSSVD